MFYFMKQLNKQAKKAPEEYQYVAEIEFPNRKKSYYFNTDLAQLTSGNSVLVQTTNGQYPAKFKRYIDRTNFQPGHPTMPIVKVLKSNTTVNEQNIEGAAHEK